MAWNSWEDCNFIETPDFFKQILWGCFGLRTASEVKSDLIIGFLNLPYPPNFRSLGHPHGLQKLVERERARNWQLLYLRNSFAAAGKNVIVLHGNGRYHKFITHQTKSRELINLLTDLVIGIVLRTWPHLNTHIHALILAAICSYCELYPQYLFKCHQFHGEKRPFARAPLRNCALWQPINICCGSANTSIVN